MKQITITENEAGQRLDRFIRKLMKKTSLSEIYKAIRTGSIKVNGKKCRENKMLSVGDVVDVHCMNAEFEQMPKKETGIAGDINIVYEDENIIIIDKPAGLLSHPQSSRDRDTLVHRLQSYIDLSQGSNMSPTFSPALCNRLDRNTAGLVIAAKNYKSLKAINAMIRERKLKKLYLCVVKGSTQKKGEISGFIEKDEDSRMAFLSNDVNDGKKSITYYEKKDDNGDYSLLQVELITGRFHQIRAHLSSIGHPIIGDVKYGDKRTNEYFRSNFGLNHQMLLAHIISIQSPPPEMQYLKNKTWRSTIPKEYDNIIKHLFGQ